MIGFLSGRIRAISGLGDHKGREFELTVLLDVNGVGYEVSIPASSLDGVVPDSAAEFFIHTDVRENAIQLFGFREQLDKQVFLLLKRVKGIGSKTAMATVGLGGAVEVLRAIANEDTSKLKAIPGVGSRTAERIIVELRELVRSMLPEIGATVSNGKRPVKNGADLHSRIEVVRFGTVKDDVALALERLGFSADRASDIVRTVAQDAPDELDSGELLRRCLATL